MAQAYMSPLPGTDFPTMRKDWFAKNTNHGDYLAQFITHKQAAAMQ